MACPHCHQEAPIVFKGAFAYCAACDRPRAPFSGKALQLAGQPSKFGGRVGRVLGVMVLVFGLLLAAALIIFLQLLFPSSNAGYAFGLPIALISLVVSALLLVTGGRLQRSGSEAERQARVEALYALAVNRGGALSAVDAARALRLLPDAAEALLADLAKTEPHHVSFEIDEEGQTFYLFSHEGTRPHPFGAKYRVEPGGRVRVMDTLGAESNVEELRDGEWRSPRTRER